jgi:hypothetical protein
MSVVRLQVMWLSMQGDMVAFEIVRAMPLGSSKRYSLVYGKVPPIIDNKYNSGTIISWCAGPALGFGGARWCSFI